MATNDDGAVSLLREMALTDTDILCIVTMARISGRGITSVGKIYLQAREHFTPDWRDGRRPIAPYPSPDELFAAFGVVTQGTVAEINDTA